MKRTAAIFALLATLPGCVTSYEQPAEGPGNAVLIVKNLSYQHVTLQGFANAADCSGGRINFSSNPLIPSSGEATVIVKPADAFSFDVRFMEMGVVFGTAWWCHLPATFSPQAGRRYTAQFSKSGYHCDLAMTVETPAGPQPEPSYRRREPQTPVLQSGSSCK